MKTEVTTLKEVYLNLWFRGILFALFGIWNMFYVVEAAYDVMQGMPITYWITFINVLVVLLLSHSSVYLQKQRAALFEKIKKNL